MAFPLLVRLQALKAEGNVSHCSCLNIFRVSRRVVWRCEMQTSIFKVRSLYIYCMVSQQLPGSSLNGYHWIHFKLFSPVQVGGPVPCPSLISQLEGGGQGPPGAQETGRAPTCLYNTLESSLETLQHKRNLNLHSKESRQGRRLVSHFFFFPFSLLDGFGIGATYASYSLNGPTGLIQPLSLSRNVNVMSPLCNLFIEPHKKVSSRRIFLV